MGAGEEGHEGSQITVCEQTVPDPCGSWLACDAATSVYRVDAIAGKPAPTGERENCASGFFSSPTSSPPQRTLAQTPLPASP
ncbi:hypothetical protein C7A11_20630 [Pseudomonas simiae]|nr:hypothetical protein C7A11_20630 [Pseudomonas simiae]